MKFDIVLSDPFKRKLKKLKKKYPRINDDLSDLLTDLENGEVSGDPIPGLNDKVFKIRCASSDMKRGKRGGYRVIYYMETSRGEIYLLTIYAKAEIENIPVNLILEIIQELSF